MHVFRKRGTFAKEDTGVWDKEPKEISRIEKSPITGQLMYYVKKATIMSKPFVRSEIFLVKSKEGPKEEEEEEEEVEENPEIHRLDWRGRPMYYKDLDSKGQPKKDKEKEERGAFDRMMQPFDPDVARRPGKRFEVPPRRA